jgi:hypothetical protein
MEMIFFALNSETESESTFLQIHHHTHNYFLNIVYTSKFNDEIFLHWPNLEKFPTSLLSSRIAIIYKMNESCK